MSPERHMHADGGVVGVCQRLLATIVLVCAGAAAVQQVPAQEPVVSAAALKLGAALKEQASPELTKWVGKRAGADPAKTSDGVMGLLDLVEKEFAKNSPQTRDAIVYLVFYSAHEIATETLNTQTRRLKEIDDEIGKLREQLRIWERVFSHPPPGSATAAQREMEIREANTRLELLARSRSSAAQAEAEYRKRANGYLVLLNHGHKTLAEVPPKILSQVQPVEKGA